ncbi:hypothetical protein [Cellulomonas palmilytica]|uniref:hypothetical protein n=1 Tax=Cellulomonas palmilytica TaxID=2608402 RepID=UPI001F4040CF|nr:hypothetical protein [Cellulomonas palmilytica]UJP40409.1 hypothetical protein F1D97_02445 [Cellulomonas palmilytica]
MTLDRREVVSLEIPAGLATVWEHLREPALVSRWYGADASGQDPGARAFVDSAVERRDVEHDSTTHTLTWPNHDVLSVTAAAHEPHLTRVVVTRRSHDALPVRFDGNMDEVDERWITDVHQLQFALAHQAGQERRTLVVQDADAGERRTRLLDRLGLHGVRGVPVGGHLQAQRPDGTMLGGTLLYKTDHQLGIRLHGVTDSLLVLLETPVGSHPPHGTVTAVLSVFGLQEDAFADVAARWQAWWRGAGVHEPLVTTG